jgi:hypothetical protein
MFNSYDPRATDDPRGRDDEVHGRDNDRRDPDHANRAGGHVRERNDIDPRDVFMRDLDLPRGPDREIVHDARDREYTLRGSEIRTLSTVGAFRVVSARDLRDYNDRPADPRSGDLRHRPRGRARPNW